MMSLINKLKNLSERIDIKMAVKMAITAIVALYLCIFTDIFFKHPDYLTPGLWCVISAMVVLQANLGGTYKAIWNRFIGVVIGSSIGAFIAFKFGAEIGTLGMAIFITIVICSLLGIPESYRMSALSVAIIMIPWKLHPTTDPWMNAFFRFFDTSLGFIVAILVSHVLWPSQALIKMRLNMAETFNLFRQFFEHLLVPEDSLKKSDKITESLVEEVEHSLIESRKVLEESNIELFIKFISGGIWLDLINNQELIWESLRALQNVFNPTFEDVFDKNLKEQVHHTIEVIDLAFKELSLKLKNEETRFDFNNLRILETALNQELIRFRGTHRIKKYHINVVEDYFVFFYQLKHILTLLYHCNELLDQLEKGVKTMGDIE